MKGLKLLMMMMLMGLSTYSMADGDAQLGEQANCGPNSTCGECVVQGTGSDVDGDGSNLPADASDNTSTVQ